MSSSATVSASLQPRLDDTAKLLLLLARPALTEQQQSVVKSIAERIGDWDEFASIAARKFIAATALRHLKACAPDIVPHESLERMRSLAAGAAMASLRVIAAQRSFHRTCIEPIGAQHAYLKGFALANQYAGNPSERYCRDIDVLVPTRFFGAVLRSGLSAGYRLYIDQRPGQPIDAARDIDFLIRYADVVSLVGNDKVAIEVHKRLDRRHIAFDTQRALDSAEVVSVAGTPVRTLSKPYHFNYLCYHHARHFWSHLHWVMDLNGLAACSMLDRAEVFTIADKIGIRPTIEAALHFADMTAQPDSWADALSSDTGGGQFLRACLINLQGGMEIEERLREERLSRDLVSRWQVSNSRQGEVALRSWLRKIRPSPTQYFRHRLRPSFHWLYVVRNAFSLLASPLKSALARLGNARGIGRPNVVDAP